VAVFAPWAVAYRTSPCGEWEGEFGDGGLSQEGRGGRVSLVRDYFLFLFSDTPVPWWREDVVRVVI
jgi:hypothetical protein